MRGRRSSRSAAVVLAGCVGLAVMAPGLALAADPVMPTTETACKAAGYTWTTSGTCVQSTTTPDPSTEDTVVDEVTPETPESPVLPETPATPVTPETQTLPVTPPSTGGSNTMPNTGQTGQESTQPAAPEPVNAAALTRNVGNIQSEVNQALAIEELPLADLLPLPDLPVIIPQPDADGNFENVNAACLNAISQLQFPEGTEGLDVLSEQLQGFCEQLDPTTLTDLLGSLLELLNGLIPSLPTPSNPIPNTPPANIASDYWGYWHQGYDVDCPELSYEEANAILAADASDPFRLDADNDGVACEANANSVDVEEIGYPVGGVATGDGSTGSGASGVEVALAAGVLSGLGVTGLALVRRFARQG